MLFLVFTMVNNISVTILIGKDLLSPLIVSSGKIFSVELLGQNGSLFFFVRHVLINAARFSSRKVLVYTLTSCE